MWSVDEWAFLRPRSSLSIRRSLYGTSALSANDRSCPRTHRQEWQPLRHWAWQPVQVISAESQGSSVLLQSAWWHLCAPCARTGGRRGRPGEAFPQRSCPVWPSGAALSVTGTAWQRMGWAVAGSSCHSHRRISNSLRLSVTGVT